MGHDSTKLPNQGLYFSWEPVHPKFRRGFLVTALTPTSAQVFKKNNSVGGATLRSRRKRRPSCFANIKQTRRNLRSTLERYNGPRELLSSCMCYFFLSATCPSFIVRRLNNTVHQDSTHFRCITRFTFDHHVHRTPIGV